MAIVGYIIYGFAVTFPIMWILGTRRSVRTGGSVQIQTLNTIFLFIVSLILIPVLKLSPLHVLWMYPASWILGMMSIMWPLVFLSLFGKLIGTVACIGLDKAQIARNKSRREKLLELMRTENISGPDAKKKLIERGEW